jgi:hypothetical protein
MKLRIAAGAAVLFSALFLSGCAASPGPAPVVPPPETVTKTVTEAPANPPLGTEDIFRPDQSSCQPDLTKFVTQAQMKVLVAKHVSGLQLVDSLNQCLHSIGEAAARHHVDLGYSGGFDLPAYQNSFCQVDMEDLAIHEPQKVANCWNAALAWNQLLNQDDPLVYQR